MATQTPTFPDKEVTTAPTDSPTGSNDSLMVDPSGYIASDQQDMMVMDAPGYIAPDQQDMMFTDITSTVLHSEECTDVIGRGNEYLSEAKSFPLEWPATGVLYGLNRRLMISLPCRLGKRDPNNKVLNIFFVVDTGSPVSLLAESTSGPTGTEGRRDISTSPRIGYGIE